MELLYGFTHLTEYGLLWTDKTPTIHGLLAIGIGNRKTNMEDLTVIGYVRIIAIGLLFTGECIGDVGTYECCITWQI